MSSRFPPWVQIGMFSYTGMTPAQVENMTKKHHVRSLIRTLVHLEHPPSLCSNDRCATHC